MSNQDLSDLRRQVERFLSEFQSIFNHYPCTFKNHPKNVTTMIKLGFTRSQRDQVLRELTTVDYYAGPKEDKQHGGVYWEFGKEIKELMIYIKIKIHTKKNGTDFLYCYSFHESDFPMNEFPLA